MRDWRTEQERKSDESRSVGLTIEAWVIGGISGVMLLLALWSLF